MSGAAFKVYVEKFVVVKTQTGSDSYGPDRTYEYKHRRHNKIHAVGDASAAQLMVAKTFVEKSESGGVAKSGRCFSLCEYDYWGRLE